MVTIFILPFHAFGHTAELLDGARPSEANDAIDDIDLKLLARLQLQGLADFLWNDDLIFGETVTTSMLASVWQRSYRSMNRMTQDDRYVHCSTQ